MQDLKIIILAGGTSSRFKPLGDKNLYKFFGKSLIERQVENVINLGVGEVVVIANESTQKDTAVEVAKACKDKFSKDIEVLVQVGEGQAGAIKTGLNSFSEGGDVLIINMNDVFDPEIFELFDKRLPELKNTKANALVGYKVENYFPGGYLTIDEQNHIVGVVEKPGEGNEPSDLIKPVFDYFADIEKLKQALAKAESAKDDVYEVALTDMMTEGEIFELMEYSGTFLTVKYPWHILEVMEYFLEQIDGIGQIIHEDAFIDDRTVINGDVVIDSGAKLFAGAVINGPAYIGPGAIIGNNALVRNSMVGARCVVGFASEVARSYLGENNWLHMNYVGDSIFENNISFGSTAVTGNLRLDEDNIYVNIKGEKIDTGKKKIGAIIGSNVRLGVGVKLMPGVKIGGDSAISPGLVVAEDVEPNSFIRSAQKLQRVENKLNIADLLRE